MTPETPPPEADDNYAGTLFCPWWDAITKCADLALDAHELAAMEARLAETDCLQPAIQARPAPN
jgi:hypothetical protein